MIPVAIIPEEAILPLDLPGDSPKDEAELDEILDWLADTPIEPPTIEVGAVEITE